MRSPLAALGSLTLAALLAAGPAAAQAAPTWVFFTDKGAAAAPAPATDAALARRALRGTAGADRLDRPVAAAYVAAVERAGGAVRRESRWLNAVSADLTPAQATVVAALPFVRGLRPVGRLVPARTETAAPPVPSAAAGMLIDYGASQTQLAVINAIPPLERGVNGTGVRFGFLDTEFGGFQHTAFAKAVTEGRLGGQRLFTPAAQTDRHGQAVASIAAGFATGQLVGPGYGAILYGATTEYAPTETNAEEDAFVAGLEWLEAQGVDVVNSSLGYTTFDAGQRSYTYADLNGDTGVTTRAADAAVARGVVVVVSAGNEGASAWRYIGTPADGDSVIAVGAVSSTKVRASFSSVGPTADGRIKPDVAAMGVGNRFATGNGPSTTYGSGNGTSFSSPMVAGVVAQMLQVNPRLTPIEVRTILRNTASQANAPDNLLGWGVVNADAAVIQSAVLESAEREARAGGVAVRAVAGADGTALVVRAERALSAARLDAFDLLGRRVGTPFTGAVGAGASVRVALPAGLAPGVYAFRLDAPEAHAAGTFVVR